jgi:hypothetical protein
MKDIVIILIVIGIAFALYRESQLDTSQWPPSPTQGIFFLAQAIAVAEGSPADWNNPGDLTKTFGFNASAGPQNADGVLKFDTIQDGVGALYAQLSLILNGGSMYSTNTSLSDFGASYAGDPNWAGNVASAYSNISGTPVSTDSSLGDLLQ